MPLDRVLVRRIEPHRRSIETVAVESVADPAPVLESRTECSVSTMEELLAWCREAEVALVAAGQPRRKIFRAAVPDNLAGDILLGPLAGAGGHGGLLIFAAPAGRPFDSEHAALAQVLLEPFSVALENDHRLREMAALKEAAEADKQSLLARLGRKQLGDTIVGEDSGLRGVMERVELVARSDVPVLIFGETGTGKELVARAIHARSPRSSGPIHRVNCGAIPPELIDSQLFGHERGSFTGADETRKGWFERADGGTLFLDEIGELPPAAQVRLLRILQDGCL
jgi:transcriptional regulator with GAF, ATPase, and Fis domain